MLFLLLFLVVSTFAAPIDDDWDELKRLAYGDEPSRPTDAILKVFAFFKRYQPQARCEQALVDLLPAISKKYQLGEHRVELLEALERNFSDAIAGGNAESWGRATLLIEDARLFAVLRKGMEGGDALRTFQQKIDHIRVERPTSPALDTLVLEQASWLHGLSPKDGRAELSRLSASLNSNIAVRAARGLAHAEKLRGVGSIMFQPIFGEFLDLRQLRGRVVLVDFWATWCGPCMAQLPHIVELRQMFENDGFEVVGISLDVQSGENQVRKIAREVEWPIHFDGLGRKNLFALQFDVNAIPSTLLIDRNGELAGVDLRGALLESRIRELLKDQGKSASTADPP